MADEMEVGAERILNDGRKERAEDVDAFSRSQSSSLVPIELQ